MEGNIGHPDKPYEIDWFLTIFDRGSANAGGQTGKTRKVATLAEQIEGADLRNQVVGLSSPDDRVVCLMSQSIRAAAGRKLEMRRCPLRTPVKTEWQQAVPHRCAEYQQQLLYWLPIMLDIRRDFHPTEEPL